VVTSDLDEFAIAGLASAPVDGYGVGTSVVTGSGAPTAAFVYKLVARRNDAGEWQPVAKHSVGKRSHGGRKHATRQLDADGVAVAELVRTGNPPPPLENERALQLPAMRGGKAILDSDLAAARARCAASIAELPVHAMKLSAGNPAIDTVTQESP
jgi:nicotinate phosphoribosyltransferase